ncbi:MAG: hypothetical protein GWO26_22650, partial [Phycisphaerae bacterium]|nr:hypothetical protein [Phycisphaerae bacterium]
CRCATTVVVPFRRDQGAVLKLIIDTGDPEESLFVGLVQCVVEPLHTPAHTGQGTLEGGTDEPVPNDSATDQ